VSFEYEKGIEVARSLCIEDKEAYLRLKRVKAKGDNDNHMEDNLTP